MASNMWDGADFDSAIYAANAAATNVANLAAAIGNKKQQEEYNSLQRELARERNALEKEEFEKSLAWEREKLLSQQSYASFANQLSMARSAGVNPYTAIGNPANGGSSGSPGRSSFQTPNQVVEDGFAQGLHQLADGNIQAIRQLAASRKDNAEATAQNISNVVLAERNAKELESLGLGNAAQKIRNERDAALSPLQVENQEQANIQLEEQNALLRVQAGLARFDLNFLKPAQYNQLLEETQLAIEKQITEEEYRNYLSKMGNSAEMQAASSWLQAQVADYLKYSERERNFAQASLSDTQAEDLFQQLLPEDKVAVIKDAKVQGLLQDVLNKKISFYEAYQRAKLLHKDLNIKDFTNVERVWSGVMKMVKSLGLGGTPLNPMSTFEY